MITAAIVKELRDKTNAGMMDCKRVLTETNGDLEASIKLLRERGIAKAGAKADRAGNEGVITARVNDAGTTGILLEVNCETDFVSKNENFQAFVTNIADKKTDARVITIQFGHFPLITMRLFGDEERGGTLETLLTAPVKTSSVVIAKYLAQSRIAKTPCL